MEKEFMIESLSQLAAAIGVSRKAVTRWVKDDRWIFGPPPWPLSYLPKIRAWRRENLQEDRSAEAA